MVAELVEVLGLLLQLEGEMLDLLLVNLKREGCVQYENYL